MYILFTLVLHEKFRWDIYGVRVVFCVSNFFMCNPTKQLDNDIHAKFISQFKYCTCIVQVTFAPPTKLWKRPLIFDCALWQCIQTNTTLEGKKVWKNILNTHMLSDNFPWNLQWQLSRRGEVRHVVGSATFTWKHSCMHNLLIPYQHHHPDNRSNQTRVVISQYPMRTWSGKTR